jgi:hypothetical protein
LEEVLKINMSNVYEELGRQLILHLNACMLQTQMIYNAKVYDPFASLTEREEKLEITKEEIRGDKTTKERK